MPHKKFDHEIWEELHQLISHADGKLSSSEVMYLVKLRDMYQKQRKAGEQISNASTLIEKKMVEAYSKFARQCEKEIEYLFKKLSATDPVSVWATSILGVGAVYACSLRAYIDMKDTQYVGRIWRFAGLDPTQPKQKSGQKLTYCKRLKSICYLIGESFKKLSNNPRSFYGAQYKARKLYEVERNETGYNDKAAAKKLIECPKMGKKTDAYAAYITGKLPPAHLDMRATRWTEKLFLAHWFTVAYREQNGCEPPKPYIIANSASHNRMITVDDVLAYENASELAMA